VTTDKDSVTKERIIAVIAGLLIGGGLVLLHGPLPSTLGQALLAVLSCLALVEMRRLRELGARDYRQHGTATALWHLATMNLMAITYAWFMFDGYRMGVDPETTFKAFGSAAKDWMLASGLIGATLGLFRSTGTNSAALQALRQNEALLDEVGSLRRTFVDATDLTTMALDGSQAATMEDLVETVEAMVTIASDLPEKSELVDAFTIWILDREKKSWRILSGRGISAKTVTSFEQPELAKITEGKGIVANLAVSKQAQLIVSSKASEHAWFLADASSVRKTEGLAAVLLRDKNGSPCGALCLTTEAENGIPSVENTHELQRFEKVLQLWAGTFTLPVQRYFELLEAEEAT
jgi:hypothetical protein